MEKGSMIGEDDRNVQIHHVSVRASTASPSDASPTSSSASGSASGRSVWLLVLCTLVYFVCMLHRYSLGVVAKPLEAALHFGDGSGTDLPFQIVAGPAFSAIFSTGGLLATLYASHWHRCRILAVGMFIAAGGCVFMALAQSFLELVFSRLVQGLSQAGVSGFCASLIGGAFPPAKRARAMAVFNFGIYGGYGATFAMGSAFPGSDGWRNMFYVFAAPAVLLSILLLTTTTDQAWEERRDQRKRADALVSSQPSMQEPLLTENSFDSLGASPSPARPNPAPLPVIIESPATVGESFRMFFTSPALLVLCLASSLRTGAGIVWGLNTEQFYENQRHLSSSEISIYMSWIPAVFGSAGALIGGLVSDSLFRKYGERHRIGFLVVTQILAAPLAAASILAPNPYSFLFYAAFLLVGEAYIGTCYAVLMDLTPTRLHSFMVAVYVFAMANLGGNANLLLPPVKSLVGGSMNTALLILYPGFVAASGVLYATLWIWTEKRPSTKVTSQSQ